MTCNYCTPNKQGHRKSLYVDMLPIGNDRYKRNVTKIYREKNKKKRYFIGTHSKDYLKGAKFPLRNNGFIMKKNINYCPMCARDLIN